ncbi:hypothetical protein HYPSUDRAFT_47634 [Hypholoma sublateritium FD-334 SS-4]|uniref:DUF2415 domain-containing protein n=1 Tax=Hypholoma sublateritium (strain FD-334 SS-4) TaxID=945553 RepID=A0A0D2LZA5_HYPSF|nr:hypothetical protein HYPSUDRAFT_47634 [Hypholoma sublateritium FD-334 SS-4]
MNAPGAPTRVLSNLGFTPNSLTSLQIGEDTLIAAGGQDTEIHLSYHEPSSSAASTGRRRRTRVRWEFEDNLQGSINNSVLLTSLSLSRSNESSVDPRVGISNNDGSVRLYDVPIRVSSARRNMKLHAVGEVRLDVPVNHSSISPDGRTLLSVGDSNKIYFHQITGGARISFQPITTLVIPPPDSSPLAYSSSSSPVYPASSYTSLAAAFSTAFSGDGSKFAVASQEGVVAVWDVRSTKPMKVFHTNKTRGGGLDGSVTVGNGGASGWLSDDPWEWTRGTKAPGWCVRNVKFNSGEGARLGREVMAFTEHTSLVHVVDARTFETQDTIRVPALPCTSESRRNPPRQGPSSSSPEAIRRMAERFREMRRTSGITIAELPLSSAEIAEAELASLASGAADFMANAASSTAWPSTSTATSRNLIRRLLPVSNARQSRRSVTPEGPAHRLATRRAPPRSRAGAPDTTPAGISARLSPASASRLAAAASARTISTSEAAATGSGAGSPNFRGTGTPAIVQALGDAFRIPLPASVPAGSYSAPASIGDSTWRTLSGAGAVGAGSLGRVGSAGSVGSGGSAGSGGSDAGAEPAVTGRSTVALDIVRTTGVLDTEMRPRRYGAQMDAEEDGEGIVVVPDLGDRDMESEFHALLAVHGIESRLGGSSDSSGASGRMARTHSANTDATATTSGSAGTQTAMEYESYVRDSWADIDIEEENMEEDEDTEHADEDHQAWFLHALTSSLGGTSNDALSAFEGRDSMGEEEDSGDSQVQYINRRARRNFADTEARLRDHQEAADRMEVDDGREDEDGDDDLDFECASRGSTSRSGSPRPGAIRSSASSTPSPWLRDGSHGAPSPWAAGHKPAIRAPPSPASYKYFEDLDIAGICFDPWGEKMYVAGVGVGPSFAFGAQTHETAAGRENLGAGAVVEWSVRGADKRWWVDDGWM